MHSLVTTEKKLKSIAFGSYKSFAIALAEILYIPAMSREDIEKQVDCNNLELIREKYEENNGVILLSAILVTGNLWQLL